MDTLVEYFLRHYTLVIDNDQYAYNTVNEIARTVVKDSGATLAEYKAQNTKQRNEAYASVIGEPIMDQIEEWYTDALDEDGSNANRSVGDTLIREIMITSDTEIAYKLGKHFMPEDIDMEEYLSDNDEEDESDIMGTIDLDFADSFERDL